MSSVEERGNNDDSEEDRAVVDNDPGVQESKDLLEEYDVQKLQRECPDYKPVFEYIEDGLLPEDKKLARKLVIMCFRARR